MMRRGITGFGCFFAALSFSLLLPGCPAQPAFQATITPIYAATSSGLYAFDGASWNHYLASTNCTSLAVSGSGSSAEVIVGTALSGIYFSGDGTWALSPWTTANGLGSNSVNSLYLGSSLFAATNGGLSAYNSDSSSPSWQNEASIGQANCIARYGSYTYIAANSGLFIYNGPVLKAPSAFLPPAVIATSTIVTAVAVDPGQNVYVGTDKGLAHYSGVTSFSANLLPGNPYVHGLFVDSGYNLYIASSTGLYVNPNPSSSALLASTPVYCVYVDGTGKIYAGTGSGLWTSQDGGSTWTQEPGIPGTAKVNAVLATAPLYSF